MIEIDPEKFYEWVEQTIKLRMSEKLERLDLQDRFLDQERICPYNHNVYVEIGHVYVFAFYGASKYIVPVPKKNGLIFWSRSQHSENCVCMCGWCRKDRPNKFESRVFPPVPELVVK